MKNITDLILSLAEMDIHVYLEDGRLKVNAPDGKLQGEVLQQLKDNKEALISFLSVVRTKEAALVPPAPLSESYVLSSSQRRLWILSQFDDAGPAYNMPGVYMFEGSLDTAAFTTAFQQLIERHEILRTVFKTDVRGEVCQYVLSQEEVPFRIQVRDLRQEPDLELLLPSLVQQDAATPFHLDTGPMFRSGLYQTGDQRYVFTYTLHHIISDAWSMDILIRELLTCYNALLSGIRAELPPLRVQYKDYAVWQQEQLNGEGMQQHKEYWQQQFAGDVPVLQLLGDKTRPAVKTYHGGSVSMSFDPVLSGNFVSLLKEQECTLFMGLLAVVDTLLYRYTGQEDIVTGTSIASREHQELENQIGFYVNTLALRVQFSANNSYKDLLKDIRQLTLDAYEHQVYPFDELVNDLSLERDMSRSSLFDVMVVLQHAGISSASGAQQLGNVTVSGYNSGEDEVSKFDMTFFFTEMADALHVNIVYNKDIYNKQTVTSLAGHLEALMKAVTDSPDQSLHQLDFLSAPEKQELLQDFAISHVDYDQHKTIVDLFREQALRTPNVAAVAAGDKMLTYQELHHASDKLAAYLIRECNVGPDDIVGIMLDRSAFMIIALLGILKAGAAYVALEPDTPRARKALIVSDTSMKALVTQSDYVFDIDYFKGSVFAIDIQLEDLQEDVEFSLKRISPSDLAYVIYTSGSTGIPKGVMITHHSLMDYCAGIIDGTNITQCKRFGLVSTIAADLGNTVLYPCLITGGTLHVFSQMAAMSVDLLQQADLDCLKIVPSHWKALQQPGKIFLPARCIIFGGEQLTADIIAMIKGTAHTCEVYNHYGPSETTIGKLLNHVDLNSIHTRNIPLGRPFGNTSVYILDAHGNPVPVGVAGEICIGGNGLAKGYLHQPALTAEKFIVHSFQDGERLYKTGDQGKWLPDGAVLFLGRRDEQVKIRGYRIELGEIAAALKQYAAISQAVVLAHGEGTNKELIAYIVSNDIINSSEIERYLGTQVPGYMVPSVYVQLEEIPLTANGKTDRKRLPDPAAALLHSGDTYTTPETDTERCLVAIWEEVLDKAPVGTQTSFFYLGGNSLKIIKMSQLVTQRLGVNFSIDKYFEYITIRDIARIIDQELNTAEEIVKEPELMIF